MANNSSRVEPCTDLCKLSCSLPATKIEMWWTPSCVGYVAAAAAAAELPVPPHPNLVPVLFTIIFKGCWMSPSALIPQTMSIFVCLFAILHSLLSRIYCFSSWEKVKQQFYTFSIILLPDWFFCSFLSTNYSPIVTVCCTNTPQGVTRVSSQRFTVLRNFWKNQSILYI